MPMGGHLRLVVENPSEVFAVREDVSLVRQVCAAAVDEVDARQTVFRCDFLRSEVLLDRHREIRAALDCRVVGDDQNLAPVHTTDAGDDAGAWRFVSIHAVGGQRAELQKRGARIEQAMHTVTRQELAAADVLLAGLFAPSRSCVRDSSPQVLC